MARKKKINIPKHVQSKFKRSQYKVGDVVYFSWLSERKFGEIIQIDKQNEEVTYKVKDNNKTIYRCGLKVKEYKNWQYGFIDFEKTKEIGPAKCKEKYSK